jgi:hypothetical protein
VFCCPTLVHRKGIITAQDFSYRINQLVKTLARLRILSPPTCVGLRYGHLNSSLEAFLDSLGSATSLLCFAPRHLSGLCKTDLPVLLPTGLDALNQRCAWPTLLCHPFLKRSLGGIGFSTDCPSPTPFGLGLGPGLPWADEPSPGNLRFSAKRILTSFFAYSCRHSLFPAVHKTFRFCFCPLGTLPYPYWRLEVRN